jgi:hypothetical protein
MGELWKLVLLFLGGIGTLPGFSFVEDVSFYFMKLPLPCEQATNTF